MDKIKRCRHQELKLCLLKLLIVRRKPFLLLSSQPVVRFLGWGAFDLPYFSQKSTFRTKEGKHLD